MPLRDPDDGSRVRQVNGDSHRHDPTALTRPVVKLESAPIPIADTGTDPICYCPECGARLRAVASAAAIAKESPVTSTAYRATLLGWTPEVNLPPSSAAIVDDGDEPTKVVRQASDLVAAAAPRLEHPAAPKKPPVPVRQKLPSVDDEESTARIPRVEDLKFRPSPSVTTVEPSQSPAPKAEPAEAKPAMANSPPTVASPDPKEAISSLSPATVERRDADLELEYPFRSPRRRGAALFPILGLGLGIAVAGGLAFLVYGNTTSNARGKPMAVLARGDEQASATLVTQVPAATTPSSAAPAALPSSAAPAALPAASAAATEPALVANAKRDAKSTTASVVVQKSADATKASDPARTVGASEAAADGTNREAADTNPKRHSASSTSKAPNTKAAAAEADESDGTTFDSEAAASALESAAQRASSCRQSADPSGVARVTVTFAPSGRVTTATIAGPPFVGTPTGSCIAMVMRGASVPAFSGSNVTVHKTVTIL
jgi:hypothetical protein